MFATKQKFVFPYSPGSVSEEQPKWLRLSHKTWIQPDTNRGHLCLCTGQEKCKWGDGVRWDQETVNLEPANYYEWIVPIEELPGEGTIYPSITIGLFGVLNGIDGGSPFTTQHNCNFKRNRWLWKRQRRECQRNEIWKMSCLLYILLFVCKRAKEFYSQKDLKTKVW